MRVSKEQAAENRERVIETASRLLREHGIDGIGVADLMRAAGLTHGGFYGQFASKDDLVAEACARSFQRAAARWENIVGEVPDKGLERLLASYLSPRHREEMGGGCALTALAPEAARRGGPVRRAFKNGYAALLAILERTLPGRGERRRRRAITVLSAMVGAVVLSRVAEDPAVADEILSATAHELAAMKEA